MSVFEQSVVNVIFVTYYVELFDVLTIKVLYSWKEKAQISQFKN